MSYKIAGECMELVYLFSNWIFVWWMLYKLKLVKYSPIFALWFAAVFIVGIIIGMVLNYGDPFFITFFIIKALVLMKLIPLATLHEPITLQSVYAFVGLSLVYLLVAYATGGTIEILLKNYSNMIFAPEKTLIGKEYERIKNIDLLYEFKC